MKKAGYRNIEFEVIEDGNTGELTATTEAFPGMVLKAKSQPELERKMMDAIAMRITGEGQQVFTPEDVVTLFKHQTNSGFHPYTCPHSDDGHHRPILGDLGTLIPTVRGWECPFCKYRQNWFQGQKAH